MVRAGDGDGIRTIVGQRPGGTDGGRCGEAGGKAAPRQARGNILEQQGRAAQEMGGAGEVEE